MADSLAPIILKGGVERYRRCRRIRNRIYRESLSRVVLGSGGPTIRQGHRSIVGFAIRLVARKQLGKWWVNLPLAECDE